MKDDEASCLHRYNRDERFRFAEELIYPSLVMMGVPYKSYRTMCFSRAILVYLEGQSRLAGKGIEPA